MTNDLSFEKLRAVIHRSNAETAVIGDMGAYLYALLEANSTVTGKGVEMLSTEFIEAVEKTGLGDKWRRQGREEGREESKLEAARAMFLEGDSFDKIERVTKIPIDRLRKELLPQ